jgi:hypothetical protein
VQNEEKARVEYRRSTLLVPILLIVIGAVILTIGFSFDPVLGLVGGGMVFIGILALGYLLVMIIGLELAARKLAYRPPSHPLLSEEMRMENNKDHEESKQD